MKRILKIALLALAVVNFSSCLTTMLEVAYGLKDVAGNQAKIEALKATYGSDSETIIEAWESVALDIDEQPLYSIPEDTYMDFILEVFWEIYKSGDKDYTIRNFFDNEYNSHPYLGSSYLGVHSRHYTNLLIEKGEDVESLFVNFIENNEDKYLALGLLTDYYLEHTDKTPVEYFEPYIVEAPFSILDYYESIGHTVKPEQVYFLLREEYYLKRVLGCQMLEKLLDENAIERLEIVMYNDTYYDEENFEYPVRIAAEKAYQQIRLTYLD